MPGKMFTIAGWSGSGKTTLITRLVHKFKTGNKRVFVVKHVPRKYHLAPEGKDSHKFLEAGAVEVFMVAAGEILGIRKKDKDEEIFDILAARAGDYDLVLLEGLTHRDIPVIEVFDSRKNPAPKFALEALSAMVTDKEKIGGLPCFAFDDIDGVAGFLENYNG